MEENNTFNIDEALKKLEEINKKLSEGEMSLDESIKLYKEGTLLAQQCRDHLTGVEKELKIIKE